MRYDTPNSNPNRSGDVRRAFQSIAALRVALLAPSPDGLNSHLPALEAAIRNLDGVPAGSLAGSELRNALEALAVELRAVSRLIEHGLARDRGWARLLAAATGGYCADGEPGPLQARGSFSLRV